MKSAEQISHLEGVFRRKFYPSRQGDNYSNNKMMMMTTVMIMMRVMMRMMMMMMVIMMMMTLTMIMMTLTMIMMTMMMMMCWNCLKAGATEDVRGVAAERDAGEELVLSEETETQERDS